MTPQGPWELALEQKSLWRVRDALGCCFGGRTAILWDGRTAIFVWFYGGRTAIFVRGRGWATRDWQ